MNNAFLLSPPPPATDSYVRNWSSLITSEHADKPNYMAMVQSLVKPFGDSLDAMGSVPYQYDVDHAVGAQLDVIGQWVGVGRSLKQPISGVYFSFNVTGVGFGQGVWKGPYDLSTGLTLLPDDHYRLLIYARILNNHWDGSKESAYALSDIVFSTVGYHMFMEDNADMSMSLGLIGSGPPDPLTFAMLTTGLFDIKPATVKLNKYITQSQIGPIFAFGMNSATFSGFGSGAWPTITLV